MSFNYHYSLPSVKQLRITLVKGVIKFDSKLIILIPLFIFCSLKSFAQYEHLNDNEYHYRFYNGLDVYFVEEPNDPLVTLTLTFRAGFFAEPDSLHGANYLYYLIMAKELNDWGNKNGIKYFGQSGKDYTTYNFQFQPHLMDNVLEYVSNKFSTANKITKDKVAQAIANDTSYKNVGTLGTKAQKLLWGSFFLRTQSGIGDSIIKDTLAIRKVFDHLYGADNALLLIRGKIVPKTMFLKIQSTFSALERTKRNFFVENPIPKPKDIYFSAQMVDDHDSNAQMKYNVLFRGPSSTEDREYFQIAPLLEDVFKNASLTKAFMDTSHIKQIQLDFYNNRFAAEINVTMISDTSHPDSAYLNLKNFFQYAGQGRIFLASDVERAKVQFVNNYKVSIKDPVKYAELFSKYWINTNISDFTDYEQQINAINIEQLCAFVHKYLLDQPSIASVTTSKSNRAKVKLDKFFTTTAPIADYVFKFSKNNALLNQPGQDSLLNSLAQLIIINPKMKVLINGVASKEEYLNVSDPDMVNFISKHPGFILTPSDLIPSKKIRLDVYRSLKVVRYLIEHNVPENRIQGTGKTLDPESENPNSCQQVYCTVNYY